MQYELIDQTGQQYGRNRQWVVATLGAKKRAFCVVPAWEDYPAEQVKADAEQVLNALNERDALRAQVAELVKAAKAAKELIWNTDPCAFSDGQDADVIEQLKAAIAAAEGGGE